MVIYEVNIKINKTIYEKYIKWLNHHIKLILKIDGFINAKKYLIKKESKDYYISIHYYIESIVKLNRYLNFNAKQMRNEGVKMFPEGIEITRRILESLQ